MRHLLAVLLLLAAGCNSAPPPDQPSPAVDQTNLPSRSVAERRVAASAPDVNTWPQAGNGPDHQGFQPVTVNTAVVDTLAWRYAFQPELVMPTVQPIVNGGQVFVGTEQGHLYAFNVNSAGVVAPTWKFPAVGAVGAIQNAVAATSSTVYLATMDGAVYGLNLTTGAQLWKTQVASRLGISTAPLMDDNASPTHVYIAARDGTLTSLNPTTGAIEWQWTHPTKSPLLQTPAYASGKVFVAANLDMKVYAIDTTTHVPAWTSSVLQGTAFDRYWPIISGTNLIIRSFPPTARVNAEDGGLQVSNFLDATQNSAIAAYDANPSATPINLHVLDTGTGAAKPVLVHWTFVVAINGAEPPGCIDVNGNLVSNVRRPDTLDNAFKGGWGEISLTTRKVVQGLIEGGTDPTHTDLGWWNVDENINVSCTQNGVFSQHTRDDNDMYDGFFLFSTLHWTVIHSQRFANQRATSNTQGGGSSQPVVAAGKMFHQIFSHQLIVRQAV